MDFYQACYGKPDGINWSVFNNTIPDVLVEHKSLFVKASSYCSPDMIRGVMDGTLPEDLYELVILKDATCLFRAKYWNASAEASGAAETRDVMFSHGFVFHTRDIIRCPEYLLSIRDDNFKFTVNETSVQPESLECDPTLTADTAMSVAGLTKKTWDTLMECIYTQRDSRSDEPLYIKAAGREKMKALIYCILFAMPKQLRYSFAFSNENSISGTMFGKDARGEMIQPQRIFITDHIPGHATYFDPEYGSTNVDLQDIQNGIAVYPTYNVFRDGSANAYAAYGELLDEVFAELKLPNMASLDEVELASLFVEGDAELEEKNELASWKYLLNLMKKLRESRIQSIYTDDYIAGILELYDRRNFTPNDTIMRYISALNDHTASPRLTEIYKKIQMRVLLNEGKDAIDAFLSEEYQKGKENFHSWCDLMAGVDGGLEYVFDFYTKLMKTASNYEEVDTIYRDALPHIQGSSRANDWAIETLSQFLRLAINQFSCKQLNTGYYKVELIHLQDAIYKTFQEDGVPAYQKAREEIVNRFWAEFELQYFDFTNNCIDNCRAMGKGRKTRLEPLMDLYDTVLKAKSGEVDPKDAFACLEQFKNAMSDYRNQEKLTFKERDIVYPKIQMLFVKELRFLYGSVLCADWINLALLSDDKNPIVKLYQWGIQVICNPDVFASQLEKDEKMQEFARRIDLWISGNRPYPGAIQLLAEDQEAVKILKSEAKAVADFQKRESAAAKKQVRDFLKQEKELNNHADELITGQAQNEPAEKKGLFGGISGLFGGKNKK